MTTSGVVDKRDKSQPGVWISSALIEKHGAELGPYGIAVHLAFATYRGEHPPSQKEVAELIGCSRGMVCKVVVRLRETGWLTEETMTPKEIASVLRSKRDGGAVFNGASVKCEWCETTTLTIHEHHYPIPKSSGGTETVSICPNCHSEYHALETRVQAVGVAL